MTYIMRKKGLEIPKQPSSLDLIESMANLLEDPQQKSLALGLVGKLSRDKKALL